VADERREKALLCCIYTFFIRYPRFFYIRHDVTTTHDTDRTFHDWASAGRGGGRMRWAFSGVLETISVSVDGYKAFF
jgi:hypothetical protein